MNLSGSPFDFFIAFAGGVLASLTPCVYPLIPISIGYIGINSRGSHHKGTILGIVYVTGIAVSYAALGLLASLTGTIFGRFSSSPVTYIFVGAIIILFGLSMLDFYIIPLHNIIKLNKPGKRNYHSVFLLGLSSGLIVSPCLTPVLGSIMVYLATKRNLLYGAALLFSFAYGMGLLLILAGTFSTILIHLPRSGKWLLNIERLCAVILIGMGSYFIYTGIRRL